MSFHQEHDALRESANRFLIEQCGFERHRQRQQSADAGSNLALWRQMAELGWLGITLGEPWGGMAQSPRAALSLIEAMGAQFVPAPYAEALAATHLLQLLGRPDQQATWLPRLCEGAALGLVAHVEPGARYELDCVSTRADKVEQGFRLSGRKSAVPWGDAADLLLVSARTGDAPGQRGDLSLFVVERSTAGLRFEGHAGIADERWADVILDHVVVPQDALLGPAGEAQDARDGTHAFLVAADCAEAVGTMDAVLQETREYASTRKQFGTPLARFQVIAHRLVDMFIQVQLARSMAQLAASIVDDGPHTSAARLRLAACKAQISHACRFVGEQAVQIHGGIGMTDELALSHRVRRLLAIDRRRGDQFHHLGTLAESVQQGVGLYA